MTKMGKRFCQFIFIALVLVAYATCVGITWYISMNIIVKIVLTIAYSFLLLFTGIDFYYMIDSFDNKIEDSIREDRIISYHFNSGFRNFAICFSMIFIMIAYQSFLNSLRISLIITCIVIALLLLAYAIYSHLKAMKNVNVFNTDD